MIPISNAIKADFHNNVRQTCSLKTLLTDNTTIYITEANLVRGGLVIDRYVSSNKLALGGAKANEMRVTINNSDGSYDDVVFEGAKIEVTIGVTSGNTRYGNFYVDKVTKKQSVLELYCLDQMAQLDEEIPDNSFFVYSGTTLCMIEQLVDKVRNVISVYLATSLSAFPNYNYQLTSNPYVKGMTYRQVLLWCAEIMGCWCYLGYDNQLYFSDSTTSSVTDIKPNDRFSSNFLEDTLVIGGITNKRNGVITTYPSYASYTLSIESNPLIALDGAASLLENIYDDSEIFSGGDLEYRPFTSMCKPMLEIEPCDKVTFYCKDGSTFSSYVTHIRYTINRNMLIESSGITSAQDDYAATPVSYITNDQLADDNSESNKIVTTITEDTIKTTNVIAENLQVRVANILGTITANAILVKDSNDNVIFSADADTHTVTMDVDKITINGSLVAQKIEVKDTNNNLIFKADATNNIVKFATFDVVKNSFYSSDRQVGFYIGGTDSQYNKTSLVGGSYSVTTLWAGASDSGGVDPKDAPFVVLKDGSVYMKACQITGDNTKICNIANGVIELKNANNNYYYCNIGGGYNNGGSQYFADSAIVLGCPSSTIEGDPSGNVYVPLITFKGNNKSYYMCIFVPASYKNDPSHWSIVFRSTNTSWAGATPFTSAW